MSGAGVMMPGMTINEWASLAWAAERLGLSVRQVGRYVKAGKLDAVIPLVGSGESRRGKVMVRREDVERLKLARSVVGRG